MVICWKVKNPVVCCTKL